MNCENSFCFPALGKIKFTRDVQYSTASTIYLLLSWQTKFRKQAPYLHRHRYGQQIRMLLMLFLLHLAVLVCNSRILRSGFFWTSGLDLWKLSRPEQTSTQAVVSCSLRKNKKENGNFLLDAFLLQLLDAFLFYFGSSIVKLNTDSLQNPSFYHTTQSSSADTEV